MRLQKFLARAGVCSRRHAEQLIVDGCIKVNGAVVSELGAKVVPGEDSVEYDGKSVSLHEDDCVIMLNKPIGFLSAMSDKRERTVAELLPLSEHPSLFPIGRLDKNTKGLLLFTADGQLGNALLHPSSEVWKRYVAIVEGSFGPAEKKALEEGVMLEDGMSAPAKCKVLSAGPKESRVQLEIHEGRKREVRRMMSAVGHGVRELRRTKFGPIDLGNLKSGSWRYLDDSEKAQLRKCAGLDKNVSLSPGH